MKRRLWVSLASLATVVTISLAGTVQAGTVGVTAKVGTLGFGGDVTLPVISNVNVRAGYNGADLKVNVDLDQATCEGDFKWSSIPILLDWHPAGGEFRLSAGVIINNNEVGLSATPKENFELNGTDYSITGLDGSITFNQVAAYVGIGSGNAVGDGRVHFAFDLGVMFQGKPKAEATATAANPALQSALNADLQVEVNDFQKDLDSFIIYPVLSMGISFTF